jgi:hypothetical protein
VPILVTESGIETFIKDEQRENALEPILVTELGIETLVKEEQLLHLFTFQTPIFIN